MMEISWDCAICSPTHTKKVEVIHQDTHKIWEIWEVTDHSFTEDVVIVNVFCPNCGIIYRPESVGFNGIAR